MTRHTALGSDRQTRVEMFQLTFSPVCGRSGAIVWQSEINADHVVDDRASELRGKGVTRNTSRRVSPRKSSSESASFFPQCTSLCDVLAIVSVTGPDPDQDQTPTTLCGRGVFLQFQDQAPTHHD